MHFLEQVQFEKYDQTFQVSWHILCECVLLIVRVLVFHEAEPFAVHNNQFDFFPVNHFPLSILLHRDQCSVGEICCMQ